MAGLDKAETANLRLSILFSVVLLASPFQAAEPSLVGTVVKLTGNWRIENRQDVLRLGQGVPAGATLRPESAESGASISIALLNGEYLGFRCDQKKNVSCAQGLKVPATYIDGGSSVHRVVQAVMDVLLERSPDGGSGFSSTMVRAGQDVDRKELVIPFEPSKPVPLTSVVSGLSSGGYTIKWAKQTRAGSIQQKSVRWDSRREHCLLPVVAPGLYSVRFANAYSEPVLDLALLVSKPDLYRNCNASFQEARQLCAEWRGPDAADSAHRFMRAYLISLAAKNETE